MAPGLKFKAEPEHTPWARKAAHISGSGFSGCAYLPKPYALEMVKIIKQHYSRAWELFQADKNARTAGRTSETSRARAS
jgi:hypothetical protein